MSRVVPTTCPLDCPDACGILVSVDDQGQWERLSGNPEHGWSKGHLCNKTMHYGDLLRSSERLLTPLVREGGKKTAALVPATWEQALDRIAERVRPQMAERILALWYGGTMGLVQRKFPLRMMHALGATLHDGGVCDASGTAGYELVLGRCLGPDIESVEDSDALILWGCDAVRTHQHLLPRIQRLLKRGVPVVVIDIWHSDTLRRVEAWGGRGLVLKPGTDAMLALALARLAFDRDHAQRSSLERECVGSKELEDSLREGYTLVDCARVCGVSSVQVLELYRLLSSARKPFVKTGIGWARRRNGGMSMRAVCAMAAVFGHADRVHFESPAHFALPETPWLERPDLRPTAGAAPRIHQVQTGRELQAGRFDAVFVWCHNPVVTLPQAERVRSGLASEAVFTVVHELFLTETAQCADVVLPATHFLEHEDLYRSYGHRWMQWSEAALSAPQGPRCNVDAFAAIAQRLGLPEACWKSNTHELCTGFAQACGERLDAQEQRILASHAPLKPRPKIHRDRGTPSGKIELWSEQAKAQGQPPLPRYVPDDGAGTSGAYHLLAAPSIATHNSTFVHSARHRAKAGSPRCFLHPDELKALGASEGTRIKLTNDSGTLELAAHADACLPRNMIRVDGLPRAQDLGSPAGLNTLVPDAVSDVGAGNVLYSTRVNAWI